MFDNLKKYLNTDFEKELYTEAINNLNSKSRIRFCNFAYVMRELLDIVLERLADDSTVMNTPWYIREREDRKVTRNQRLKYILQGAFDDRYINQILNYDINPAIIELNKYISVLSKHTHIREKTFNYSDTEVDKHVKEFRVTIDGFIQEIGILKQNIARLLLDILEEPIREAFMDELPFELDCLSTHTTIDYWNIEDVEITNITTEKILGTISGTVEITLQYGSDGDCSRDIGATMDDSYPFSSNFEIEVPNINKLVEELNLEEEDIIEDYYDDLKGLCIQEVLNNHIVEYPIINTNSFYE